MGGSIAVTLREVDGTEHRMCRWTNILPWVVNNMRLINKDESHIKSVLKEWYNMREDYKSNKKSGKFKFNMTDCYAPYPFLAPEGYGLVIIDMKENYIVHSQSYTSFGEICTAGIQLDRDYLSNDESDFVRFKEFFEANRVEKLIRHSDNDISLKGKSFDEVMMLVNSDKFYYASIDMLPYKVIRYEEQNYRDALKMKKQIEDLGFKLTKKEEKIWSDWLKDL